ncbi:MAG: D-alanine aminotransferase [Hydrogenibacillus schlegelii]|uniref:D-alanine aminotransferase n=1 Tax=Hydrogenibacillus schlegelii TaxID=1484 RepID=A0A2T5GEU9_HYDSH|nr:D-amino-acid transaminase [Hydrogenibacillus schlegelii]PTQ54685.1 MAG: D-alanine aminotransferase [Hydrogenibacillus schlegelii]
MHAYWNGEILPLDAVRVSPLDRGFVFGDGVYEVIRLYGGRLFYADRHWARLARSLQALSIAPAPDPAALEDALRQLIAKDGVEDGIAYVQVTRGAAPRTHAFPAPPVAPSVLAYVQPIPRPASIDRGGRAVLYPDLRWQRVDIKSVNLLGNVLAKQHAVEAGADEAILHRDGLITEGSSSNIFIVKKGIAFTHPATNAILNGITRQLVLELMGELGLPVVERPFSIEALWEADEVFITSTINEVTPIVAVDGIPIAGGKIGPWTAAVRAAFSDLVERVRIGAGA